MCWRINANEVFTGPVKYSIETSYQLIRLTVHFIHCVDRSVGFITHEIQKHTNAKRQEMEQIAAMALREMFVNAK